MKDNSSRGTLKNYQETYRFIPFFLVKLPSAPSNSPSVLPPIPSSPPIHVIGLSLSELLSSVLKIGIHSHSILRIFFPTQP
jgi:hypothetical protein